VFGVVGSPATLDPYSPIASDLTRELAAPVYPSLYRFDPMGRPHEYLARSMAPIHGGVRVTLRAARWSDGRPVTAADVVRTVRRATPPSGFSRVTSARAAGPRVVELHGTVSDWPQALATAAYVLPGGKPQRVSAGPLTIRSFTPGLQLVFTRNGQWWGRSYLAAVKVVFVQSLEVLLALLQNGRLDVAAPPSSVNIRDRLRARGLNHSGALGWESIQLRFYGPELSARQRRALAASIRRRMLMTGLIREEGRTANTLHPGPGPRGADGPWSRWPTSTTRIARRIELSVPVGDELLELMQRVLQREMAHVAPDLELVAIDPETFYGRWRLDNPTQVALRRGAGAPGVRGDRDAYLRAAAFPLFQVETLLAWRDSVHGLRANPTFQGPLWNVEAWFRRHSPSRRSP
jgi:Bacterial extracellular solute-binding proteins, family 5 Middle